MFWKNYPLPDDQCFHCRIGPLYIWLIKKGNEMLISEKRINKEEPEENWQTMQSAPQQSNIPENVVWKRWIINDKDDTFKLLPDMPSRPVVVRPENQTQIMEKQKTCFYISIPVVVRIISGDSNLLTEIPTLVLSNIWFGEPIAGEACYSVRTTAVTSMSEKMSKPYTAVCPICIENLTAKPFNFAKFAVHTEYLSIYAGEPNLWTNQIDVKIEGDDQKSVIEISEDSPQYEEISNKLCDSRETPSKKLYKKVFSDFAFRKG